MVTPASGEQNTQNTPGSAQGMGNNPATPPAQGGATGTPPAQGAKTVPITVMHEERDKRQAAEAALADLRAEIDALKAQQQQFNQPQPQPQYPYQQPMYQQPQPTYQPYPTPPANVKQQIDELWDQDIRKGFQAEMMAMMQYRDWVDTKVDSEFEATRSRHQDDFSKYEGKVRSYMRSLPIESRAQDNIVEAAYLMVKGQDTDNIIKQREQELIKKYQSQYGATGLNGTFNMPTPASGQQTITPEERVAAQAMGLSDEDYIRYRGGQ